jgi:uncharacterized membrane protein
MKVSQVQAIKMFFEASGRRVVTIQEFRQLTPEQRLRLATACAKALGVELVAPAPVQQ